MMQALERLVVENT